MVRKVAIYTRVSTLDQTIDNQLIELRDHCSRMGWEIVKEYADDRYGGVSSVRVAEQTSPTSPIPPFLCYNHGWMTINLNGK